MTKLRTVDLGFLDTAEVVLTTDVDLPASIDEVWDVVVDNESWVRWLAGCRRVTASPEVWADRGDTRTVVVGAMKIDEVAVAVDGPHRWAMCLTKTTVPIASAMLEMLELADTSREGEVRTEVRWTGAIDRRAMLRPFAGPIEARLVEMWGRSLENLLDEVVARR